MHPLPPDNPWAPPATEVLEAPIEGGVWREGSEVVLLRQAELPPRCVRCNAPVYGRPGRQWLYWHHPGWYLLLVLNLFLYALVAIFVRQSAVIRPGLCPRHRRRRFAAIAGGTLFFVGVLVYAFTRESLDGAVLLGSVFGGFAVLLLSAWLARTVRASKIDHRQIRLKGADPAFLDSLPNDPH